MGIQLDWREESWEEPASGGPPAGGPHDDGPAPRRSRIAIVGLLTLTALALLSGWWAGSRRDARQGAILASEIDAWLLAEQAAFLAADVDAWLALHEPDPAWQAAQFLPYQQAALAAGQRAVRVETDGGLLWATLGWDGPGGSLTRVAFFERHDGALRRLSADSAYWGSRRDTTYSWGTLRLSRADAALGGSIAAFVSRTIAATCPTPCPALTVIVDASFAPATASGVVRVPSPQLVGLDADGQPGAPFWALLEGALRAAAGDSPVRFGVPDESTAAAYRSLAALYAAANPGRVVEIMVDPLLATDPSAALAAVDGALLFPTPDVIAGGQIADLTPYIYGDADFDQGDYYAQIWDGGWWRERMWVLPLAAQMRVVFYDRAAYEGAQRPQPSLHWTWTEMEEDIAAFAAAAPAGTRIDYGLLDYGLDLLYARAFTLGSSCRASCFPLAEKDVAATLAWYSAQREAGTLLDLSRLEDDERQTAYLSALSSRRRVAIWIEDPMMYEHHLLLNSIGVLPFPAGADFESAAPLSLQGGVISRTARDPYAVWEWLDFLSYQSPQAGRRLIPARPSVADATGYWQVLPRPLDTVMRAAFPRARAVTIADRDAFTWALLANE